MGKHGHGGKKKDRQDEGAERVRDAAQPARSKSAAGGDAMSPEGTEREEKRRRKEAERAEKESRKEAEREEKRRRKQAAREEKLRAKELERAEKQRRKEAKRAAKHLGEAGGEGPVGLPREQVVAEEMAEATVAAELSLGVTPGGGGAPAPGGGEAVSARKRGIPASAHARGHSTSGAHGSSEVEVRGRRGRHAHVDLFDAFESIHWREFKILLKPEDFSDDLARDVADYWRLARRVSGQLELAIRRNHDESMPRLREIVFLDTPEFDFYRNSFMLRVRRDVLPDGPAKEYELTLKFRDSDVGRALGVDPRPAPGVSGVMKFKEEILLVSSALGGMRSIFSHTCQLKAHRGPFPSTFAECLAIFPMLSSLALAPETPIRPAADVPVEEVLYDLGEIGFRGSKTAKVDMAIWRNAETKKILIGEFAYETHFRHYGRLNPVPKLRSERLYRLLQRETGAWVELGNTKTWLYYGLSGRKVHDE